MVELSRLAEELMEKPQLLGRTIVTTISSPSPRISTLDGETGSDEVVSVVSSAYTTPVTASEQPASIAARTRAVAGPRMSECVCMRGPTSRGAHGSLSADLK